MFEYAESLSNGRNLCILIVTLSIGYVLLRLATYFFKHRNFCVGIPVLRGDSIFGYVSPLISIDQHRNLSYEILSISEKIATISQFYAFGCHVVLIADKYVAKLALEKVQGKGFFHVSYTNPILISLNQYFGIRGMAHRAMFLI